MLDDKKNIGLKEKIDEKEKKLIGDISTQVADQIGSSLYESIENISETLSDAENKAQDIKDVMENLSQNVQTINTFDFSDQFNKVKRSQEALEQSSKDAKEAFDKSKEINKQLTDDISSTLKMWQEVRTNLEDTVKNINSENADVTAKLSELKSCISELSEIDKKLIETIKNVESRQSSVIKRISEETSVSVTGLVENKINSSVENLSATVESNRKSIEDSVAKLSVAVNRIEDDLNQINSKTLEFTESNFKYELAALENNHKQMLAEIDEIKNKMKISPLAIITSAMVGVLIVLNIISFFI